MGDELQHEDVLVFNLDHDVLVKLRHDASMTIEAFGQDTEPMRLTVNQQLLLLDRLCRVFAFPSPIEDIVMHQEVGAAPPDEDDEAYTMSPLPRPGVDIAFTDAALPVLPPPPDVEGSP